MSRSRNLWVASALLGAALVPTVLHVYLPPPRLEPGSLARELGLHLAKAGPRDAGWARRKFDVVDFVSVAEGRVELFGARTYGWKKLFHFPENDLAYGEARTARRLEEVDGFPAHVLEFETSDSKLVACYALFLGKEPVRDPYAFLLARVPSFLVAGRPPMTLLYAQGDVRGAADEARLRRRLAELAGRFAR